jgi:pimeloyl-ACP methyl ester carboxylesterase
MGNNIFAIGNGRSLEVWEYGDPSGHPVFFFHGLIGSHHQASYVTDSARQAGLRLIAPNRPGVGRSEFTVRASALATARDVEQLAQALGLAEFSVIGISGGTPYALAALHHLGPRVRTVTVISGMGPMGLAGSLRGMDHRRRLFLEVGSRFPRLAAQAFQTASDRFRAGPEQFLDRLIRTWSAPDRALFERNEVYDLFMLDLHQVFAQGIGAEGLAQELVLYRNYGFALRELSADRPITLWHALSDTIVPPPMAWAMVRALPNAEAHLIPGGHFVAIDAADRIIGRLRQLLDDPAGQRARAHARG